MALSVNAATPWKIILIVIVYTGAVQITPDSAPGSPDRFVQLFPASNPSSPNMSLNLPNDTRVLNLTAKNLTAFNSTIWVDYPYLQKLDASNNLLMFLSTLHSSTIQEMNLSNGKLLWIREDDLRGVSNLERLNVNNNRHLTKIELNVPKLVYLDASHCSLTDLSLDQLINLESLNLSHNRISTVRESVFASNSQLKVLDLSHNGINYIDDYTFIRSVKLETLDLSWNQFSRTEWSMTLKSVMFLDIAHNDIETIDVLMLRRAHTLNVSQNKLTHLPDELGRLLPHLQVLDVSSNPIRTIKRVKSNSLKTLLMKDCKLEKISREGFSEVPALQLLDVSDNKLRSLDFVTSLQNASSAILNDNSWDCACNLSVSVFVLCQPSNLSLADFCAMAEDATYDSWFLEAANPIIWAPLVVALVIVVVACFGFKTYKKFRQNADIGMSYESVPIDLIRNLPDEEEDRKYLLRALLRLVQEPSQVQTEQTSLEHPKGVQT